MSDLRGAAGELRCTVSIKRKATGNVETYELVARTNEEQHAAIQELIAKSKPEEAKE